MATYMRNEIPRGSYFSHHKIKGSYYRAETFGIQPEHYEKYDEDGILTHAAGNPPSYFDYYISNVFGNPIGEQS